MKVIIYLKFEFDWATQFLFCFVFAKSGNTSLGLVGVLHFR